MLQLLGAQLLKPLARLHPGLHCGLPSPRPLTWCTTFKNAPMRLRNELSCILDDAMALVTLPLTVTLNMSIEHYKLECGPMPNLMAALPNTGGALCSTPQSLADAHY